MIFLEDWMHKQYSILVQFFDHVNIITYNYFIRRLYTDIC